MSGCGFGKAVGTDVGNESTFLVNRLNNVSNRSEASTSFGTIYPFVSILKLTADASIRGKLPLFAYVNPDMRVTLPL